MSVLPEPKAVEQALLDVLRDDARCRPDGDELVLDTPYILQDGHLLQVYLSPADGSGLSVTDGGFAASQAEVFARSPAVVRERRGELQKIAERLGLEWDGEFRFVAPTLADAMQRVSFIACAVDRALSLNEFRPGRPTPPLRRRLQDALHKSGLKVTQRAKIPAGPTQHVTVDYRVARNGHDGAVRLLSGQTQTGAEIAVDCAVTIFHLLVGAGYPGELFAVYDEESVAAESKHRDRFWRARPERAVLLSGHEAEIVIQQRLSA